MSDVTQIDAITGEIVERDYTPEELADIAELAAQPPIPEPVENPNPIEPPA